MGNHEKNESEMKVNELDSAIVDIANSLQRDIDALIDRVNALERAFEKLLNNAEEKGLNLHGGDGEWY